MYVIVRTTDNHFVAPPGHDYSYTNKLQFAWLFATAEEADTNRCKGNEVVRAVAAIMPTK